MSKLYESPWVNTAADTWNRYINWSFDNRPVELAVLCQDEHNCLKLNTGGSTNHYPIAR